MSTHQPAPIEPESMFAGLRWRFIVLGALLDNTLSIVATLPVLYFLAGPEALSEDEEAARRALELASASGGFLLVTLAVGCSITALAGWWAASRAGALHVRHGGWTAVASVVAALVLALALGAGGASPYPLWYELLGYVLVVPAGMLGGWCAALRGAKPG